MTLDITKPPFQTRDRTPMHFVGHDLDGDTVWQSPDMRITFRDKNGRVLGAWSKPRRDTDADIINAPPPKGKERLWANIYPPDGGAPRGFLYSTLESAKSNAVASVIATVPVEVEYTPKAAGVKVMEVEE